MIDYEKGADELEINLLDRPESLKFNFKDFINILDRAKKLAIQCAKEDELRNQSGTDGVETEE